MATTTQNSNKEIEASHELIDTYIDSLKRDRNSKKWGNFIQTVYDIRKRTPGVLTSMTYEILKNIDPTCRHTLYKQIEQLLDQDLEQGRDKKYLYYRNGIEELSNSILLDAILANDSAAVEYLLSQGIDPNTCSTKNDTALVWAIHQENYVIVEILLKYGADISNTGNRGPVCNTPFCQHDKCVKFSDLKPATRLMLNNHLNRHVKMTEMMAMIHKLSK